MRRTTAWRCGRGHVFYVYKLTSPSGRAYVGYTGQAVAEGGASTSPAHTARHTAPTVLGHSQIRGGKLHGGNRSCCRPGLGLRRGGAHRCSGAQIQPFPGGERDFIGAHARMAELRQDPVWDAQFRANLSAGACVAAGTKAVYPNSRQRLLHGARKPSCSLAIQHRATRAARRHPRRQWRKSRSGEARRRPPCFLGRRTEVCS